MTFFVKTCGFKTADLVAHSMLLGASEIGFIFFDKSPRHVTPKEAALAAKPARGKAGIVAVCVNADDEYLDDIVTALQPDMLQFHGSEDVHRVKDVKTRYDLPVMKAFAIRDANDLRQIDPYIGVADRFLFDAKAPKTSQLPGGNGISFDWSLLEGLGEDVNYMLSGGLNLDNACAAIEQTNCMGLDISSGIESKPGVKDKDLMDGFFKAIQDCA